MASDLRFCCKNNKVIFNVTFYGGCPKKRSVLREEIMSLLIFQQNRRTKFYKYKKINNFINIKKKYKKIICIIYLSNYNTFQHYYFIVRKQK